MRVYFFRFAPVFCSLTHHCRIFLHIFLLFLWEGVAGEAEEKAGQEESLGSGICRQSTFACTMDASGMSRADFIRACISALEERGDVAAPSNGSKQPSPNATPPKNNSRSGAGQAAATASGRPRGMALPAARNPSQSGKSGAGGSPSNGSLQRASQRPPLPVHSVLSRIRDRNTAQGSVNAADLKHAAESVARWINDFERDHRSLRTFVAQFSAPTEAKTTASAAAADVREVAPCSVEFLDSLSAFCDEADTGGASDATGSVRRASQPDATPSLASQPTPLNQWRESMASLAAVLCVKLPLCLGRFEKVLLRKNFAGVFLGADWCTDKPEQARKPTESSRQPDPLLQLREALVAAGSHLPLEVIGAVPHKFWKQNQMTDGVLRLQALQLDLCEAAAQRRRVWSCKATDDVGTGTSHVSGGNAFVAGESRTCNREFWVAEYNFLQILREVAIGRYGQADCNVSVNCSLNSSACFCLETVAVSSVMFIVGTLNRSDMRTSAWKAVADWTNATLKQEHDRLQAESLDVALEPHSKRSGSLDVACVYAASQFTADLLRGLPRPTMRKFVETGTAGRRILEVRVLACFFVVAS